MWVEWQTGWIFKNEFVFWPCLVFTRFSIGPGASALSERIPFDALVLATEYERDKNALSKGIF